MTIIFTILSQHGAVAASDSLVAQITQVDSEVINVTFDPLFDKTFSVGDWLIGACSNLMFLSGKSIGEHINSLFLDRLPMPTERCMKTFIEFLHGYFTSEVMDHQSRKVTVFMASRIGPPEIQWIDVRPQKNDPTSRQLTVEAGCSTCWVVGGDDNAKALVSQRLSELGDKPLRYTTEDLERLSRDLVNQGIAASGYYPEAPAEKTCGGIPMIKTLRFKHSPAKPTLSRKDEPLELKIAPFFQAEKQVGRNNPCPCGSGKKYKKCCMSRTKG